MIKVNCLNNIAACGLDLLGEGYDKGVEAADANVILVRSAKMHDMDFSDSLYAIARAGAGVNNIPLDKCAENGIVVFNTPGANANAVKEEVIAAMLLASRDYIGGNEWVRDNANDPDIAKSVEKAKKQFGGSEIKGKKLGVIGLGAIGQLVANAAVALGMEVYGYDPYLSVSAAWHISRKVHHISDVNDIFKECDFITIHVPALDSTKGMVGKEAFEIMKPGMTIINCARDIICDEEELLKAIESGIVKKYVTDFANPTVVNKENVIILPHLGASTAEAEDNCAVMAVNQIKDFIENGNIVNSVNYPACNMGECRTEGRITVCHKNVPTLLSQITSVVADASVNIADLTSKSRGEYAYTILDLDIKAGEDLADKLQAIDGVIRARVIK